jgi:hypothetical protein
MSTRTDPTNEASSIILLNFEPLNNPKKAIDVLRGILIIKKGVTGNNVTTSPLQCAYCRGCLTGEALRQFTLFGTNAGNETSTANVEDRLVQFFAPQGALSKHHRYMCYTIRKHTSAQHDSVLEQSMR